MNNFSKAIDHVVSVVEFDEGFGVSDGRVKPDTEAIMANRIAAALYGGYFKAWNGAFMCYSGKRWVRVNALDDMPKIVLSVLRKKKVGLVYQMPNTVKKIVQLISQDINIRLYSGNKRYISFRNCILDMNTLEKLPFSETYESIIYLDFDYDEMSECPIWDQTLKQIISDDASISVLHEFLGLIFLDRSQLNVETMLFLIGTGGNGKGIVFDMIKNILGENCSSTELSYLCTHNQAEYYRAGIAGKLLNFCSDMGVKEFSNGVFKKMVSYEPVECRHPGERAFETRDMPLMAASINKMPIVTDSTDGFWRRCKFIHFGRTFSESEQDKMLKFKLRVEISGVFNRILKGMNRIKQQEGNFTESVAMKSLGKSARIESNSVLSWCRENRYVGVTTLQDMLESKSISENDYQEIKMFSSDIMRSYVAYCNELSQMPKSKPNLSEDLKSEGFVYKERMRIGVEKVSSGFVFYRIHKEEQLEARDVEFKIDKLAF